MATTGGVSYFPNLSVCGFWTWPVDSGVSVKPLSNEEPEVPLFAFFLQARLNVVMNAFHSGPLWFLCCARKHTDLTSLLLLLFGKQTNKQKNNRTYSASAVYLFLVFVLLRRFALDFECKIRLLRRFPSEPVSAQTYWVMMVSVKSVDGWHLKWNSKHTILFNYTTIIIH